ncbi:MAG: VWA domain-containing protein [Spirochaetales bacterium]|nr:VWA domain-containing protein [Spirochaetales bacterium]
MKKAAIIAVFAVQFLFSCSDMINDLREPSGPTPIDLVINIDGTASMSTKITAYRTGLNSLFDNLTAAAHDVRIAVMMFGYEPELIVDWTTDTAAVKATLLLINHNAPVAGVHGDHSATDDSGLETIRISFGSAVNNSFLRTNVGGSGPLEFRPTAKKKLFFLSDEASSCPYFTENRQPDQDPGEATALELADPASGWRIELSNTANTLAGLQVETYLFTDTTTINADLQYSNHAFQSQDADWSNFNHSATLQNLNNNGLDYCLQAQLLAANKLCRCVDIDDMDEANVITNVILQAVQEALVN